VPNVDSRSAIVWGDGSRNVLAVLWNLFGCLPPVFSWRLPRLVRLVMLGGRVPGGVAGHVVLLSGSLGVGDGALTLARVAQCLY